MKLPITLKDLAPIEHIKLWTYKELWTIDEAAYILAGIDPDDVKISESTNWESAPPKYAHSYQIKFYNAMRRAITTAIEVGTLSPFTLWIEDENSYSGIVKVTNNTPVSACEIITARTNYSAESVRDMVKE